MRDSGLAYRDDPIGDNNLYAHTLLLHPLKPEAWFPSFQDNER